MKKKVFLNITKIVSVLLAMSLITGAALATDEGHLQATIFFRLQRISKT